MTAELESQGMDEAEVAAEGGALSAEERAAIERIIFLADHGTFYELMGLPTQVDKKMVQQAFYDLSRSFHPDRFFRREIGEVMERLESAFVVITDAYRTLSDPERKAAYDTSLRGRSPTPPLPAAARPPSAAPPPPKATAPSASAAAPPRAATPPPPSHKPTMARPASKALVEAREQIAGQLRRARQHYDQARADLDAGNIQKAASNLQLALTYDPKNADIAALAAKVQRESRKAQAGSFISQAEGAESFANFREALSLYRKAIDYGTENAKAFVRAASLIKKVEEGDQRRLMLDLLRKAVKYEPDQPDYRVALGNLYADLDMQLNARREYDHALRVKKDHAEAKEAIKRLSNKKP
jgi:curved DNA-binding protein CbpA